MNWEMLWTFANSELGITLVAALLAFALGKVFTAKPKWKVYVEKYRPLLIEAVKRVEKEIPSDGTAQGSMEKLGSALQFVLAVNRKLDADAVKRALTAVHAEVEAAGNLKKD